MGFYQPLLSVSVEHQYFSDGLWKGLDFVPDAATSKVIAGAGLLARPSISGIGVFYDQDRRQALQLYVEDAKGPLGLTFKAYARDKAFANYTAPSRRGNAVLCFDSRNGTVDPGTGKTRLSSGEAVSEQDFEDMDSLVEKGVLGDQDRRAPPDFVLNVFVEPGPDGGFAAQDYVIGFDARRAIWKYHLLGNMNRGNPFIVDLDNRVEFEFCGEVMLSGNKPAKVFRSKELLPFLEKSHFRFQLREPGPGSGKVLIKRLPVASGNRLGMEVINGKNEIVSESFVNY
ncbi:MAG: hypothetical protein ACYCZR_02870 [Burkholderiales bacterium]